MELERNNIILAAVDANGEPEFLEPGEPVINNIPGVYEGIRYWTVDDVPSLFDNIGSAPKDATSFTLPGGVWMGMNCFPANSSGKLDVGASVGEHAKDIDIGVDGDPSMHRTNSIDFEYIISGKVDFELPGGKVRTLVAGDILIVAGVDHAWKNHYDEPCKYLAVCVGAKPPKK